MKKCASKLVCDLCMSLLSKSELELVCKKSVCKLMCDVCMSLVNKPEVGAGLRKKCMCKLVCEVW